MQALRASGDTGTTGVFANAVNIATGAATIDDAAIDDATVANHDIDGDLAFEDLAIDDDVPGDATDGATAARV